MKEAKPVVFDVQSVAERLAGHRAEFVSQTIQARQTMANYQVNTTYSDKATRIEDLNRDRKVLIAQKEQKEKQIESLGRNPFKGKQRKELEGEAKNYATNLESVEKKLAAELEAMGYSGKDLNKADAAVKDLRQKAAEERRQAQESRVNGDAAKKAEQAKEAYLEAAKAVPEDQKAAVADAVARFYQKPEKVTPDSYRAEQEAKQQLDVALKPEPQQKEQPDHPGERRDERINEKDDRQMSMEEVMAQIAKERQAEKLNPTKAVERTTTKGWSHDR